MTYELYKQGPEAYLPVLLLSAIITVLAYGAFPFIFAKTRNTPITKKKYNRLCYGINAAVMFVFILINGGAVNGAPYLLWTWIFTNHGKKVLSSRGILIEEESLNLEEIPGPITMCASCKHMSQNHFKFCPKCGKSATIYVYDDTMDEDVKDDVNKEVLVEENTVNELNPKVQKQKKSVNKKLLVCLIVIPIALIIVTLLVAFFLIPGLKYSNAKKLLANGNYELAYTEFLALDGFYNSEDMLLECRYLQAVKYRDAGEYELANKIFESLGNYRDSKILIHKHDYRVVSRTEATCTVAGNEVLECLGCKDSYTNYLEASHKYVITKTVDATCTTAGSKSYECSSCHNTYTEKIALKMHSYSSATCTKAKTCLTCGKTDGKALGHTTSGVKCTRCGEITFKTLTYSGTGSKIIKNINVPKGTFLITGYATSTDGWIGSFYVYLNHSNGYQAAYWIDSTNSYMEKAEGFSGSISGGYIEVDAGSNIKWKITIEAVGN